MVALNANSDTKLAKALKVELLKEENIHIDTCFQERTISVDTYHGPKPNSCKTAAVQALKVEPLLRWSDWLEKISGLERSRDVAPAYIALVQALDRKEFSNQLLTGGKAKLILPSREQR